MTFDLDFLRAGDSNGDAICIRYDLPDSRFMTQVVDGGFADTGALAVDHMRTHYGMTHDGTKNIAHMLLTHGDNDHAGGLIRIFEEYNVHNLWMNMPWAFASEVRDYFHGSYTLDGLTKQIRDMNSNMVKLEEMARKKGIPVRPAFQGTQIGAFTVLSPSRQRFISLIPDFGRTPTNYATSGLTRGLGAIREAIAGIREGWGYETLREDVETNASNESSVVQIGILEGKRVLLTGDAGPIALRDAAAYAYTTGLLGPLNYVQIPHHGSRHNVTPSVLTQWLGSITNNPDIRRGWAIASVGRQQSDYPRRAVSNAFLRRGYPVVTTRSGTINIHSGPGRAGWGPSQVNPFYDTVETWDENARAA